MPSAIRIHTFEDILRALRQKPEWLEELRRMILTDELLALPRKFEKFEEKFERLEGRFERLEEKYERLEGRFERLEEEFKVVKQDVAELKGDNFERKVRERAPSYFGRLIRKCRVLPIEELADLLDDAVEKGIITEEEREDALKTDVVVTGVLREDSGKRITLVTEVSMKADRQDVERAYSRAKIIGRVLNLPAISVVIGKEYTEGAKEKAVEMGVILC
jgi:predicted nuclease with TOPRIM domain